MPQIGDPRQVKELLRTGEVYATSMLALAYDRLGTGQDGRPPAWLKWAPQTLDLELSAEFAVDIAEGALHRLMAGITILTTDLFWKSESRFISLCNVLAGDDFDPTVFEPADPWECAWGIAEAMLLDPPSEDEPEPFSDEVRRYIGYTLREAGFISPPAILKMAIDADFTAQVAADYADSPELFQGFYQTQLSKAAEVDSMVKEGLFELFEQLKILPLKYGDTDDLGKRIQAAMAGDRPAVQS